MGTVYQRGKTWWVQYYQNGKPYQESSRSRKKMVAHALLKQREGEIGQGKTPGIYFDKVTFDELAEDFLRDYKINERKSTDRATTSVEHLKKHFEGMRVTNITSSTINRYVDTRLEEGAANGTVNRELAALKRMLNIGARQTPPKVDRVPYIELLKENNIRTGFFSHDEFLALRDALPDYMKGFVTFAYKSGWRRSEISKLTWGRVDLRQSIVRLEAGETKNDAARNYHLDEELKDIFMKQWEKRKQSGKLSPYVFPAKNGKARITDIRFFWNKVCKEAKLGKRLFHDFRRTAIRDMIRAGIPERVAMMISGHKTRTIFDRYNIVNDEDLRLATQRQEVYQKSQTITKTVTMGENGETVRSAGQAQVVDFTGGAREGTRTPTGNPTGS